MDQKTTVLELKEMVRKFCEDRDWDQFHNPKDLAIGILTEGSELIEHFRFKSQQQIDELMQTKRTEIAEELSDVLMFVLRFGQMYDFDLSEELERKLKLSGIKYPVEKCKGRNTKYNEL